MTITQCVTMANVTTAMKISRNPGLKLMAHRATRRTINIGVIQRNGWKVLKSWPHQHKDQNS